VDLQRLLKAGDLYAEYVRFTNCFRSDTTSYLAIIFNGNVDPVVRPLFAESALKSIAERSLQYSGAVQGEQRGLRGFEPEQTAASVRDADTLGSFLFASLPELAVAKRFLFVPDGLLNRIAFSALRWKGRYLFEMVAIRQLSSSGSLRIRVKRSDSLRFLLAGGVRYEKSDCNMEVPYRYLRKEYSWNYLPGSALEISRLSKILLGYKNVKVEVTNDIYDSIDLSGYTHLHLATHGFYFSDKLASNAIGDSYDKDYLMVSPLARCGLVIDRANCSGVSGYLLGYELANMDLTECQLITLSACETALGDIKSNQGVLGLQQALKIAGAGKLLLAMWKIPDQETAEFMDVFYRHLIAGSSEEEALRRTQSVLSKKYPISSWGAFTLID
jgi:CHAT domain-containing protein